MPSRSPSAFTLRASKASCCSSSARAEAIRRPAGRCCSLNAEACTAATRRRGGEHAAPALPNRQRKRLEEFGPGRSPGRACRCAPDRPGPGDPPSRRRRRSRRELGGEGSGDPLPDLDDAKLGERAGGGVLLSRARVLRRGAAGTPRGSPGCAPASCLRRPRRESPRPRG